MQYGHPWLNLFLPWSPFLAAPIGTRSPGDGGDEPSHAGSTAWGFSLQQCNGAAGSAARPCVCVCVCVCVNAENSGGSVFFVWGTAERREGKRGNLHQERSVAASCSP